MATLELPSSHHGLLYRLTGDKHHAPAVHYNVWYMHWHALSRM
jgi:hypothetical protein